MTAKLVAQQARQRAREAEGMVKDLRRMLGKAMAEEAAAQKARREAEKALAREGES